MPRYIYKVRDNATGKIQESQAESSSKDELVNLLHDKNKTVISVEEFTILQSSQKGVLPKKRIFDYFGSIAIRDKINFCSQLATLLESGITLVRALEILAQQMQSEKFRLIILQVKEDIKQGLALHKAFAKKPDVFSPLWINLIETGEASGELPSVLRELAKYFELSALIRSKLTTALIYPSIIMVAAILAIIVFVTLTVVLVYCIRLSRELNNLREEKTVFENFNC